VGTAGELNRDQIVKIARLTGCKNFVGKRKKFIFNAFVDLKPVERVTVIKFRMDSGDGNAAGCFEVEIWADTTKFTSMIVAGFRKCRDLVGEGKVFIKDKAKVVSRVGCSERRVVYFRKLLFKSDKKKLSFRRVEKQAIQRKKLQLAK